MSNRLLGTMRVSTRDYIHNLEYENRQLQKRIDKALEYIEKHKRVYDIDGSGENRLDEFNILASPKVLTGILKGNNEVSND